MNKKNLLIEISDLNKKFILENNKNIELIKNLSFKLKKNSKVSITGPSGSGKTTLLNIIGLLDSDFDGLYLFKGKNISSYSTFEKNKLRGLSIGFIHQFFHLIPELSVIENVMLPILINRNDNKAYEISKKILFDFGLEDRIDYKPLKLSGGEQQRVAIARAFACKSKILFADEPTGNLDPKNGELISKLLFEVNAESDNALVIVTHDHELANNCDKKIELKLGQIVE